MLADCVCRHPVRGVCQYFGQVSLAVRMTSGWTKPLTRNNKMNIPCWFLAACIARHSAMCKHVCALIVHTCLWIMANEGLLLKTEAFLLWRAWLSIYSTGIWKLPQPVPIDSANATYYYCEISRVSAQPFKTLLPAQSQDIPGLLLFQLYFNSAYSQISSRTIFHVEERLLLIFENLRPFGILKFVQGCLKSLSRPNCVVESEIPDLSEVYTIQVSCWT